MCASTGTTERTVKSLTLEKAIELLKEAETSLKKGGLHDHAAAVQLGTEALRRTKLRRETLGWKSEPLLLGEVG